MLPPLDANGLLPAGQHTATWSDIEQRFVKEAPYPKERSLIFDALRLHVRLMSELLARGKVWIDGGFVTHKPWSGPDDVDLAYLVPRDLVNDLPKHLHARLAAMITLQGVSAQHPGLQQSRVQPMGGLVDAFIVMDDDTSAIAYWATQWTRVKGEDGSPVDELCKGYLEVAW